MLVTFLLADPLVPFCESERDMLWQILWPTTVGDSTATVPCGDGIHCINI